MSSQPLCLALTNTEHSQRVHGPFSTVRADKAPLARQAPCVPKINRAWKTRMSGNIDLNKLEKRSLSFEHYRVRLVCSLLRVAVKKASGSILEQLGTLRGGLADSKV